MAAREDDELDVRQRAMSQASGNTAFERLYDVLVRDVYRFVYSKVGNREEAEDLTSQVFLKAMRGLDETRTFESMQAWVFQVARTTIADSWREYYRLRAQSLDRLLDAGWDGPQEQGTGAPPSPQGPHDHAHLLLEHLPPRYRDVLTYRFLSNYSVRETAAQMGISEANVKVLQLRALRKAAEIEESLNPTWYATRHTLSTLSDCE